MPDDVVQRLMDAEKAFTQKQWGLADALTWQAADMDPKRAAIWNLAGRVALAVGAPEHAKRFLQQALALDPYFKPASKNLKLAEAAKPAAGAPGPRYLLIREWKAGFFADVDHVLGQLLLAEITGRTPVVWWGAGSKFADPSRNPNAWDLYFEPLSGGPMLRDLRQAGLTYFPAKWNAENLDAPPLQQWTGPGSRLAAVECMARPENVVVSDFHTRAFTIMRWIPPEHPLHGRSVHEVYRFLMKKYVRPSAAVMARADEFFQRCLAGGPTLAVHVRGTDKVQESNELVSIYQQLPGLIKERIARSPNLKIFALTDSQWAYEALRGHFGDRVVVADTIRVNGEVGIHLSGEHQPYQLGLEVVADAVIASRCDEFLGVGPSNVSSAVWYLKDWAPGTCTMLGTHKIEAHHRMIYLIPGLD
ncbi:MAG: hypothetical protein JSR77_12070 [Planctomycetes bacterium]|nr:hypothetical protein [Planctomycetota bacterium]